MMRNLIRKQIHAIAFLCFFLLVSTLNELKAEEQGVGQPDIVNQKWSEIFTPSVLTHKQKMSELSWFNKASEPLRGLTITSTGEDIETSFWESQYLALAFEEITGIHVEHKVIGEGKLVDLLMDQLEHPENIHHYDVYVSDADLIGTHLRNDYLLVLSDYMKAEGKGYTNPFLDLDDFINLECGQDYDGRQLQIPDYHFSMLYWFRYDWFSDPDLQKEFRDEYGYDLGVPLNWSAYEDIAKFFSGKKLKNPNDSVVSAFGHADYALPGPWLGWRFSDAFLATAGMGDTGLPNGLPVDEWGIRVEDKIPVGASVERGGAINGPAAVYGLSKWSELLQKYAPPEAFDADWLRFGNLPLQGNIAQTWYWCSFYASIYPGYNKIGSPVSDKNGKPVWRVAPIPKGKYWREGMKQGYMDAGSWTIPKTTVGKKRHAAWLWAQFCLSKTVALKKFMVGATPVRKSTIYSKFLDEKKDDYGGVIEFLRSPVVKNFTDSGPNVPDYQRMSMLWSDNIASVVAGEKTSQDALDNLAYQFDNLMGTMDLKFYSPVLNNKKGKKDYLSLEHSPKSEILITPKPQTIRYEELLKSWEEGSL